jgi:hypothetical protein
MPAPRILAGTLLRRFASLPGQASFPHHALPRRGFFRLPFFAFLLSLLFGLWQLPRDCIVPHLILQPPHPLLRQMILPRIGLDPSRLTQYSLLELDLELLALREPILAPQGVLALRLLEAASGCQRVAHFI